MEFSPVNTAWVLIAAALVFFMQAGFAILESGLTRAKNAGNIIMKNLMDFCIGTPIYWFVGFGIMFGTGSLVGGIDLFTRGDYSAVTPDGVPFYAFFIFQTVFCATAATIVSGAMAERTDFRAYCIYSAIISLIVYPVSGHWIWGGGWLAEKGFIDFAGSACIHTVGGVSALIGAKMLGPRIGKFDENGKPKPILGHSITLGALGCFILWFGWYGFNGAAATSNTNLASIFATTTIAPAVSTIVVMVFTWIRNGKPDVSMTLNGSLAGLVAITAGCACVDAVGSAVIGVVAGLVVVFIVWFVENKLKIDDPVGAIAVHGGCGITGTILVGFFATGKGEYTAKGLFYGGGAKLLGTQLIGILSIVAWVTVTMTIVFFIIKKTIGLRVTPAEEIEGLDPTEHGLENAYADFIVKK